MNLTKDIFKLAIPAILGMIGVFFFEFIDIYWISKLGTEEVAGVASAGFIIWTLFSLMGIAGIGCSALIAQAIGEKNKAKAYQVAKESIYLSLLLSFLLTPILIVSAEPMLRWMGLSERAHLAGVSYFYMYSFGLWIEFVFYILAQIFHGNGDTKTSVYTLTVALVLNMILDPLFILGWGGFPKWGTFGAAFTSVLSAAVGCGLRLYYLRRHQFIDQWHTFLKPRASYFFEIMKIGAPPALAHGVWSLVYPLLTSLITVFGMVPLAGLTIAHRIEGLAYFSCIGFSIAMTTLVGNKVGERDFNGAKEVARKGRALITVWLIPVCLFFVLYPGFLIGIASDDPAVIQEGARYLRIIGFLEIFLGWEMVCEGSFSGLGNTRPYMYISVPLTFARYPVAYMLIHYFHFDVTAIWWTIATSTALKGILMTIIFKQTMPTAPVVSKTTLSSLPGLTNSEFIDR